jgi:tetratricopeptide (TPR) repeat protein
MKRIFITLLLAAGVWGSADKGWAATSAEWQTLQDQASQAYQQGAYDQAKRYALKAIARAKRADNGRRFQASSLNMLAYIQMAQQEVDDALASMAQAVALAKPTNGRANVQWAALLFNQGMMQKQAQRYEPSLASLDQAISAYLSLGDSDQGHLWQAVQAKAQWLERSSPTQAEQVLAEALIGMKGLTPEGASRLALIHQHALLLFKLKEYSRVTTLILDEQSGLQAGLETQEYASVLRVLAASYDALNQAERAAHVREEIQNLASKQPISLAKVMDANELAMHAQNQEDFVSAERHYKDALAMLDKLGDVPSQTYALVLGNLGSVYVAQKQFDQAVTALTSALDMHRQFAKKPLDAASSSGYLGSVYYQMREYDKAEQAFLEALDWLDNTEAPPESRLVALQNIQALYLNTGRSFKADKYERDIRELKKQIKKEP